MEFPFRGEVNWSDPRVYGLQAVIDHRRSTPAIRAMHAPKTA